MALAHAGHAGCGLGSAMNWVWIAAGITGILVLLTLLYWQLIIAEGTYLGPRTVAWTYDLVARRYDAIKRFNPQNESWFVAAPLLRALSDVQDPVILDVATGTGRLPLALLRDGFGGQIVGLDLSQGMLEQARRKLEGYRDQAYLLRQDADYLPFEDCVFDAVTCLESLEFMSRPAKTLSEMVRTLAPGGTLMLTNRVGREARLLPGRSTPRTQFEQLLFDHGLTQIQIRPWQSNYDLALAQKPGDRAPRAREPIVPASLVCCPSCHRQLEPNSPSHPERTGPSCPACGKTYAHRGGILQLADAQAERHDH